MTFADHSKEIRTYKDNRLNGPANIFMANGDRIELIYQVWLCKNCLRKVATKNALVALDLICVCARTVASTERPPSKDPTETRRPAVMSTVSSKARQHISGRLDTSKLEKCQEIAFLQDSGRV